MFRFTCAILGFYFVRFLLSVFVFVLAGGYAVAIAWRTVIVCGGWVVFFRRLSSPITACVALLSYLELAWHLNLNVHLSNVFLFSSLVCFDASYSSFVDSYVKQHGKSVLIPLSSSSLLQLKRNRGLLPDMDELYM
jgi:hypothetical protein